jgi:predicted PurR-regulated permease PerM
MLTGIGLLIGLAALWISRDMLMLTLSAVILAILITTPVRFLGRMGVNRSMAIVITLILVIIAVALLTALLLPGLIDQFRQLIAVLGRALSFNTVSIYDRRLDSTDLTLLLRRAMQPATSFDIFSNLSFLQGVDLSQISKELSGQVLASVSAIPSQVFPFVGGVASILLSILIVVFMAIYFVADPMSYQRGLMRLFPHSYRLRVKEILARLEHSMRSVLQVQAVIMVLTGASTGVALFFMGIPLAGALGTLTFLFAFVPNFGPLVALIPIVAVVILNAPSKVLVVIAVFYGLQLLINQLIAPLLVGQGANIPPVVIIAAQVLAGIFFGFLGLLLSVPLAAIATVLVREVYIRDILGDRELERAAEQPPAPAAITSGVLPTLQSPAGGKGGPDTEPSRA